MRSPKKIAIVIPSFNEEGNIALLVKEIQRVLDPTGYVYDIVFVDDGSSDATLTNVKKLATQFSNVYYIELSRNFGHQYALKAGLDSVDADAVLSMDSDMQHPPELLPTLLKYWEEGYDIVYTKREEDKNLSFFKRKTSSFFYRLLNKISKLNLEIGTADFRLMDKKVVDVFKNFTEESLFIRGLINWVGFKQKGISYQPNSRNSGVSKYTFGKMLSLALRGITSFSITPLYLVIYSGFGITLTALLFFILYVCYTLYFGIAISGWASLLSTIVFFGGLNIMVLGVIGIYLGKLFIQSKNRPLYIIRDTNLKP